MATLAKFINVFRTAGEGERPTLEQYGRRSIRYLLTGGGSGLPLAFALTYLGVVTPAAFLAAISGFSLIIGTILVLMIPTPKSSK